MKRLKMFILIMLCVSSLCFAKNYYKEVRIQGGYDAVASVKVSPIASQSESYRIGMPFSIDDPSVQFGDSEKGRLIANWSILANFRMAIDVEAEIMHHASESNNSSYTHGLGYSLVFVYTISYFKNAELTRIPNAFFVVDVPVGSSKTVKKLDIDMLKGQEIDSGSLVGSADGEVYFSFDQNTSQNIIGNPTEYEKLENGNYLATVTLSLKAI